MIDDEKINIFIIIGSVMLIFSFFLPWIVYVDTFNNYLIELNCLNLLSGTFGIGLIPWSAFFTTRGIDGFHIPMIIPLIVGIVGFILGYLRLFEKIDSFENKKQYELLLWLCIFSFVAIIYIYTAMFIISQDLWAFSVVVILNGSGFILCLIGTAILLICSFIIKKHLI